MKYNIWYDGQRDEQWRCLWWVEVEVDGASPLAVTKPALLKDAEQYVEERIDDDERFCFYDATCGDDLCGIGKDFKADREKTRRWLASLGANR